MRLVFGEGRWPHRENFTVQDPLAKAKAEEYSLRRRARKARENCGQSAAAGRAPKRGDAISRSRHEEGE
jgi:hypothetical protein